MNSAISSILQKQNRKGINSSSRRLNSSAFFQKPKVCGSKTIEEMWMRTYGDGLSCVKLVIFHSKRYDPAKTNGKW